MGTHPKYSFSKEASLEIQNTQVKVFIANELAEMNRLTRLGMKATRKLQLLQTGKAPDIDWTAETWKKVIDADPLLQELEDQA